MGFPAARLGDLHVCPAFNGPVPHVGGPILPACEPTVIIGGMPAARITDMAQCVGPPDVISSGAGNVLIGRKPAARILDSCGHGGAIVLGCFTVLIGTQGGATAHLSAGQVAGVLGAAAFPGQQTYGNCGVQSSAEIIFLSTGKRPGEDEILNYALSHDLADQSTNPLERGGTNPERRQQLLAAYGVDSTIQPTTRESLGQVIRDGNSAIISADAGLLWNDPAYLGGGHAVTVTGGTFDSDGNLQTVMVNDTGTGQRHEMPANDFFNATDNYAPGSQMNVPNNPVSPR